MLSFVIQNLIHMSSVHLGILGWIHDFQWIAVIARQTHKYYCMLSKILYSLNHNTGICNLNAVSLFCY